MDMIYAVPSALRTRETVWPLLFINKMYFNKCCCSEQDPLSSLVHL